MKKHLVLAGCIALLSFAFGCQQQTTPDTRAADESARKDWDAQWSKAAGAKDVDKTVSYYADDAIVMPPNAAAITTKDAVRKTWKDLLTAPGFSGGWKATKVEVARSSDIAYVSGTYEMTINDANGKPATDRGKYLEAVKKQSDGTWKCVADIWNSDLPAPASATPEKK